MYIIYDDDLYSYIDDNRQFIINSLKENEKEINDNNISFEAQSMIESDGEYLKELIINFDNKSNYDSIIVVASLGLWYGRRQATAQFKTLNIAFYKCIEDYNQVYFKKANNTLQLDAHHHDGSNNFKFYKVINNKKYAINLKEFMDY